MMEEHWGHVLHLGTDGFKLALQGQRKYTYAQGCTLNHLFLLCFFKTISVTGEGEGKNKEYKQAHMATS